MTNLLPGEKIYHVLGHVLGMCLTISIVSCGGNQKSNFKPEKNKTDSSAYSTCDKVNDTIYLNFHSNMKQEDFDKEISRNPNVEQGKVNFHFKDKYKVPFDIIPNFNECLTAIRLESQVQFGNRKIEDDDESNFVTFIKNILEENHGPLNLKGDSSYTEPKVANEDYINSPFWVKKYTYPRWFPFRALENAPNIHGPESGPGSTYGGGDGIPLPAEPKEIEELISATYKSYENQNKRVELTIVTSNYFYQDGYSQQKTSTTTTKVIVNYYSDRYLGELKKKKSETEKNLNLAKIKRDSLINSNKRKL
jgi:hypothetical protein